MKSVLYQGKRIAYAAEGRGPTLVFLHGFPMDRRVWDEYKHFFSSDFLVITIDLPGFGQSEPFGEAHTMGLMAEAVKAVLDQEGIQKAVLIGHSMGGYAALAFASLFPAMLSGLVLFHSHGAADDEVALSGRATAIKAVQYDREAFVRGFIDGLFGQQAAMHHTAAVDRITEIALSQTKEAVLAGIAGLRDRTSKLSVLHELAVPVLFILGKQDSRMPFERIMAQTALPAHAELLLLSGVGHMGFLEAETTTAQAISYFAQRCQAN